jgi:hypothetical protein
MSRLSRFLRQVRGKIAENCLRDYGLSPITDIRPQDIVLVAYPKSGVTWLQNLLAGVLYGVRPEHAPNALIQSLIPDIHRSRFYVRHGPTAWFKSHLAPLPEYRRVVYLLRDGRDVMVSYRHYLAAMSGRPVPFAGLIGPTARPWPCRWQEHVRAWQENPYGAELVRISYEQLQDRPLDALQDICRFAGIQRDDDLLRQTIENAHIGKLRRQEATFSQGGYANGKPFFRRGQVGGFREEMPPDVLRAFLDEAGPVLHQCGYLDDRESPGTLRFDPRREARGRSPNSLVRSGDLLP